MRLVFVNPNTAHPYDVGTPFHAPLGGSESGQCYLAIELARRRHEVRLLNGTPRTGRGHDVLCLPLIGNAEAFNDADMVVVTNGPEFARDLRRSAGPNVIIAAWEHNYWAANTKAHNAALQQLTHANDMILCVSDWHRRNYVDEGAIDPGRIHVLRNAISPFFQGLFADKILPLKALPPRLAFTSVPYKGLAPALEWFGLLHAKYGQLTLDVFSSFDLYAPNSIHRATSSWNELCERCRNSPGVRYFGNVPQPTLSRNLQVTSILFYPNILPETSGISVLEAMAAGCMVVTTALGALPETLAGFGRLVRHRQDGSTYANDFLSAVAAELQRFATRSGELEAELRNQVDHLNREATWLARAGEVEALAARMLGR